MNFNKDFAHELCRELGIGWDNCLTAPALQGTPVLADDIKDLFSTQMPIHRSIDLIITAGMHSYNDYNNIDPKCA